MNRLSRTLLILAAIATSACTPSASQAPAPAGRVGQAPEALWYATNDERSVQSFLAHADRVTIVAPQAFAMDSAGAITGRIDPRMLAAARDRHVKVIPLVVNPGFNQAVLHAVLISAPARTRAAHNMAALCRDNHFDGVQFDFENIAVTDRDAFTALARETGDSLHASSCSLSAAVVPRGGEGRGPTPYHQWMFDNWRGGYDYRALADAMDFLSLMTYSQHTRRTPPGPVAGLPWTEDAVRYVLSLGVPPAKVSLGIPSYSQSWYATWDSTGGARTTGSGLHFDNAMALLRTHDARTTWDDRQGESWATWENDGLFEHLWLADARSFAARTSLLSRYGLRGYSVWVLGFEDPAIWGLPEPVAH